MPEVVPFPSQSASLFDEIADEYQRIYHKPDIEALKIVLCAVASHTLKPHGYPPTWVMLIGPSGSGKTSLLEVLTKLPLVYPLNDLTPKTFLSGFKTPRGGKVALLHKLGTSAILVMKDFTTIISMRYENKAEIFSQLREIHDGFYNRVTGIGSVGAWMGRLTLITACTNAIDRERMTFRQMGDRFVEVRWSGPPHSETATVIGRRPTATDYDPIRKKVEMYLSRPIACPEVTDEAVEAIAIYACFVAAARTPVFRDEHGKNIIDVGTPETPTRLTQCLMSICLASAALDEAKTVRYKDVLLAKRIAKDSIPPARRRVFEMFENGALNLNAGGWDEFSNFQKKKLIEDLESLGIVEIQPPDEFLIVYKNDYKVWGPKLFDES